MAPMNPPLRASSLPRIFLSRVACRSSSARVERGPLDFSPSQEGAGKPSFTTCIERPPYYRGGAASKKDGCRLPRMPPTFLECHASHSQITRCPSLVSRAHYIREA